MLQPGQQEKLHGVLDMLKAISDDAVKEEETKTAAMKVLNDLDGMADRKGGINSTQPNTTKSQNIKNTTKDESVLPSANGKNTHQNDITSDSSNKNSSTSKPNTTTKPAPKKGFGAIFKQAKQKAEIRKQNHIIGQVPYFEPQSKPSPTTQNSQSQQQSTPTPPKDEGATQITRLQKQIDMAVEEGKIGRVTDKTQSAENQEIDKEMRRQLTLENDELTKRLAFLEAELEKNKKELESKRQTESREKERAKDRPREQERALEIYKESTQRGKISKESTNSADSTLNELVTANHELAQRLGEPGIEARNLSSLGEIKAALEKVQDNQAIVLAALHRRLARRSNALTITASRMLEKMDEVATTTVDDTATDQPRTFAHKTRLSSTKEELKLLKEVLLVSSAARQHSGGATTQGAVFCLVAIMLACIVIVLRSYMLR